MAGTDTMTVFGGYSQAVNFEPANVYTEIAQNVRTILSTIKGTVPLDRKFGLQATMLDDPMPMAQAKLVTEIVTTVELYEPRVRVKSVKWVVPDDATKTMDGVLIPKVTIQIKEDAGV